MILLVQLCQSIIRAFQVAELEGLDQRQISTYQTVITENNINGKVLATCDLNELGQIMNMTFGDWQLFRAWVLTARNPSPECIMWYVCVYVCLFPFRIVLKYTAYQKPPQKSTAQ